MICWSVWANTVNSWGCFTCACLMRTDRQASFKDRQVERRFRCQAFVGRCMSRRLRKRQDAQTDFSQASQKQEFRSVNCTVRGILEQSRALRWQKRHSGVLYQRLLCKMPPPCFCWHFFTSFCFCWQGKKALPAGAVAECRLLFTRAHAAGAFYSLALLQRFKPSTVCLLSSFYSLPSFHMAFAVLTVDLDASSVGALTSANPNQLARP